MRLSFAWTAIALSTAIVSHYAAAQNDGDWPMYNHDESGQRFSRLTEIHPGNVAQLREAWRFPLGGHPTAGSITGGSEFTPVVVDGMMFVNTQDSVVALAPETGAQLWRIQLNDRRPSRRGVTYWRGDLDRAPRLFVTAGSSLFAFNALSGELAADFGDGGELRMPVRYDAAPTLFEDVLIVGSNSPPGSVRAFDALSGHEIWEFLSIPGAADFGRTSWSDDGWQENPGALHWPFSMTIDVERRILYSVFDSPGPFDYYGGDRVGDNLFGNSIVALDIDTGERRWHYQVVHHDIWDYDLPQPPVLLDVDIEGRTVPILAVSAKTGYMYILNRVTGEPVFGIPERPVPASTTPGEVSSPTQPIPVKPPPLARVSFSPEDIVTAADTNAEHAAFCRRLADRSGELLNQGSFTPYNFREPGSPMRSTLLFPGSVGGANWGGSAVDPTLGYVYVNTMDEASMGWVERTEDGARLPFRRNSIVGPTSRFQAYEGNPDSGNINGAGEDAWPCQKPPWGNLLAVDAATGDIAWKVPLGITDDLPVERQRTGRLNMGGPIATASGLVFIGASNDRRFRAFDSSTGEELWVVELDMSAHAVPITYRGRDGKQYVAITAAGASALDNPSPPGTEALVVFALP